MATARDHIEFAQGCADEAYEISSSSPAESLAVAQVAVAHAAIANALLAGERMDLLATLADPEYERPIDDLYLPETTTAPTDDAAEADQ